jgi:cation diffusion facilitator family transporter
MRARARYELPAAQQALLRRAVRLQWWSIGLLSSVIVVMGLTMGASQAMRTAWAEDTLSLVPPIAFLLAVRVRARPPDARYPYGRHRVVSIAFLVAATALCAFGLLLLENAVATLLRREHPTIGFVQVLGHQLWLGWLMMAALAYSVVPPLVLGHVKLPVARALHAKVLHADANMNKADWMTGLAAIGGILGIGFGFWWADSVAAGLISYSVLADGFRAMRTVVGDLMDHAPRPVDARESFDLVEKLDAYFASLAWVERHEVRLREEGDVCVGEIFVVPRSDEALVQKIEDAVRGASALDWRFYDLVVTPVSAQALPEARAPR